MSMKKKLKIGGSVLLVILAVVISGLCYKAGGHMAAKEAEVQEGMETEAAVTGMPDFTPTPEPTPTPTTALEHTETPTAEAENKKYIYELFEENLAEVFDKSQIKQIKKGTTVYLRKSRMHQEVETVTCTEFYSRSQTRNQIYGYLRLDDKSLLQYTYDFDSKEVKVMETAVTLQVLESRKKQEEDAEQARIRQEELDKKKEELAQEIFNRNEGGSWNGGVQQQNYSNHNYQNHNYQNQTDPPLQVTYGNGNEFSEEELWEEIQNEQIIYEEIPDEDSWDTEAIFEEEIPEDVFTDKERE